MERMWNLRTECRLRMTWLMFLISLLWETVLLLMPLMKSAIVDALDGESAGVYVPYGERAIVDVPGVENAGVDVPDGESTVN
ncbi:hypothetical protein PoB_005782100 [Plakobranchus ocellatus]|uniref:Uncharacterized protein n=1 Tax=Plakobranchus ocellatus TaxID=259542 RepID=A0AAV4C7N0_9GAST|nr:hypothetical protein PoB_005782100 [Plakobranchus ocellatus]